MTQISEKEACKILEAVLDVFDGREPNDGMLSIHIVQRAQTLVKSIEAQDKALAHLKEACDIFEKNSEEAAEVFEVLFHAGLIPAEKPGPRLAKIVEALVGDHEDLAKSYGLKKVHKAGTFHHDPELDGVGSSEYDPSRK